MPRPIVKVIPCPWSVDESVRKITVAADFIKHQHLFGLYIPRLSDIVTVKIPTVFLSLLVRGRREATHIASLPSPVKLV